MLSPETAKGKDAVKAVGGIRDTAAVSVLSALVPRPLAVA